MKERWVADKRRYVNYRRSDIQACLDGVVSVSFHPNTCVSLVLVGTNTQKN
jgi:hypothetical protein